MLHEFANVEDVPGDDGVVQRAEASERAELIVEATPAKFALLPEEAGIRIQADVAAMPSPPGAYASRNYVSPVTARLLADTSSGREE